MKHLPSQLSGGQQQRVAVARTLAGSPRILLADKPTWNLDSKNGETGMDLLKNFNAEGATICMVTHDGRYANYAARTVHLFDGKIVDKPTAVAWGIVGADFGYYIHSLAGTLGTEIVGTVQPSNFDQDIVSRRKILSAKYYSNEIQRSSIS